MALLDRVKERTETDLSDAELTALITDAQSAIRERWGPDRSTADPPASITVSVRGGGRTIDLTRPLDPDEAVVVTEFSGSGFVSGAEETVLASDDYRVLNGGRTIQRLSGGTNSRSRWSERVDVAYIPIDDQAQRDEVVIKLVQLALEYEGVAERTVGDVRTSHTSSRAGMIYSDERDRLIASLSPRRGLLIA